MLNQHTMIADGVFLRDLHVCLFRENNIVVDYQDLNIAPS